MRDIKTLDRREFTLAAAMAVLSGVAISISSSACGGSSSPAGPSPNPTSGDKSGAISANHGHVAVITSAQLTAAGALSLNIQGSANHPHTVELSSADLSTIAGNGRVSKESSDNSGHSHTVTFN